MAPPHELSPAFFWASFTTLAAAHSFCTLIITALREVSNARLEERLTTPDEIELYNHLLQDDHETITDLSTLRGLTLTLAGFNVAWLYLPTATPFHLISAFTTLLGLVLFAHVLPRAFGDRFAEGIVIKIVPSVWRLLFLCTPFTKPFRWASLIALRVAGFTDDDNLVEEADDEIRSAAIEAVREGALEKSALNMIERVIDFRDVEVTEIMTPRTEVNAISLSASFTEAVEILVKHGHSRVPVYEGSIDKIIGIVHIKDIVRCLHQLDESASTSVEDILRKPLFVPESKRVRDLFGEIKNNKIHVAIIVDEYGGTAGLVTVNDIISEIFGDIDDEHDPPERESIEKLSEDSYSIDGKMHIDELNDILNLNLPEDDDYDTLSGFLALKLGKIPAIGDQHRHENLLLNVTEGDERKVDRVELILVSLSRVRAR